MWKGHHRRNLLSILRKVSALLQRLRSQDIQTVPVLPRVRRARSQGQKTGAGRTYLMGLVAVAVGIWADWISVRRRDYSLGSEQIQRPRKSSKSAVVRYNANNYRSLCQYRLKIDTIIPIGSP